MRLMRKEIELQEEMINITPYRELACGEDAESILEHVQEGYSVHEKVIAYLRAGAAYLAVMGVYMHPFKPNQKLLGPYYYTDGYYYWDRDTWKYVLKYHVTLPQEFIDHVMSDAGTKFLEQRIEENEDWSDVIKRWKMQQGYICFLPDHAGEIELENF